MDPGTMHSLETASQILLAPPHMVSPEQRHEAETVFLQFRTTKKPYEMCQVILENSSNEYLLFEAIGLLKLAVIREWSDLTLENKQTLREYLLRYLMERTLQSSVKGKLLQTIAIMVKRQSIDDLGADRKEIINQLEIVILNSPLKQRKIACSLLQALLQEFALTVKSADVGLYWEVHYKLKKQFEAMDLKRIFRLAMGMLNQLVQSETRPEGEQAVFVKQLLNIVESILCWGQLTHLLPKRLACAVLSVYESESSPSLKLGTVWSDTILQPELLSLFFKLYLLVRHDPELLNSSITCLVQMATLNGPVLFEDGIKETYLENYMNNYLELLSKIQPVGREMLGMADISRKLVQMFSIDINIPIARNFLSHLTTLTCHCIQGAINEELTQDDTVWGESLNHLFDMWGSLTTDKSAFPGDCLKVYAIEIFNTYLQCRLSPPDGTRSGDMNSEELNEDIEEDERELHRNILLVLGSLSRKAVDHVVRLLNALLDRRIQMLEEHLSLMHSGKLPLQSGEQLINLFEDLHWLLMITGHFLTPDSKESEVVLIPFEIVEFSIAKNSDPEVSLHHLMGKYDGDKSVDSIWRLIGLVFKIAQCEESCLNEGLGLVFSPELSATISWLLANFANAYLQPRTKDQKEMLISLELVNAISSRLVIRSGTVLRTQHAQPRAAKHALDLLLTVAKLIDRHFLDKHRRALSYYIAQQSADANINTEKKPIEINYSELLTLVEWEAGGNNLSGSIRKELHKVFAVASKSLEDEKRVSMLRATLLLADKFSNIVNMNSDTEPVRTMLVDTLDCVTGVAEVALDEQLFFINVTEKLPTVIYKYHNYPTVVLSCLKLLTALAENAMHIFTPENSAKYHETCMSVLDVYVKWNISRFAQLSKDAEEEAFQDVSAMLTLIRDLTARTFYEPSPVGGVQAAAAGLSVLRRIMSVNLLAHPQLLMQLCRTLRDFPEDATLQLPNEEFSMFLEVISAGILSAASEVCNVCCDALVSLIHALRHRDADERRAAVLSLGRTLLLQVTQLQLSPQYTPTAPLVLYEMQCLEPGIIDRIGEEVIEEYTKSDPCNAQRMREAFADLTRDGIFDGQKKNYPKFRDSFDRFVVDLQGFLVIK